MCSCSRKWLGGEGWGLRGATAGRGSSSQRLPFRVARQLTCIHPDRMRRKETTQESPLRRQFLGARTAEFQKFTKSRERQDGRDSLWADSAWCEGHACRWYRRLRGVAALQVGQEGEG